MKKCAYLTMESTDGWEIDADLAFPPLEERGWQIDAVPWRTGRAEWNDYDAVYIGVPWDYPEAPERFLSLLDTIDRSRAILVNDLALVHWSLSKTYLRDLESRGVDIVPSLWYERMHNDAIEKAFDAHAVGRVIVKPVISTNAKNTYLLSRDRARELAGELQQVYRSRPFVVQPFLSNIQVEGEYSLFYFGRDFSHAIQKVPKPGDFRVQEEYGARITSVQPEPRLLDAGDRVMRLVQPEPAYARIDFIRGPDDRFLVMELELIEPSMYLRMDAKAPARFAEAFDRYVRDKAGNDE
jgi:hypothetical protein